MADQDQPQPQTPQAPSSQNSPQGLNVSEQEFMNKYSPLNVSETEFMNKYNPDGGLSAIQNNYFHEGPYHGSLSDYYFTHAPVGRVLSAFGQGASESWGSNESELSKEIKWEAENKDKDKSLMYGFHTAWMRPIAAAIDTASILRPFFALGGGISKALGQTGEELKGINKEHPILGAPAGALGELAGEAAEGAGLEGAGAIHPIEVPHVSLEEARAKAVIGEGEQGYFGTKTPTPEEQEARNQAAVQAGWGPETLEQWMGPKTVPTEGELARQIDPDLFKELDQLQDLKENSSVMAQYHMGKRTEEIDRNIYSILSPVEGDESRLPEAMKDRLDNLRDLRDEAAKTPTKDELELRQKALNADIQIRDLLGDIGQAKEQVREALESDTEYGRQFRNLVQAQALERAIKLEEARPIVQKAYRDAAELIPDPDEAVKPELTGKSEGPPKKKKSPAQKILNGEVPDVESKIKAIGEDQSKARESGKEKVSQAKEPSPTAKETGTSKKLETEATKTGLVNAVPEKAMYEPTSYKTDDENATALVQDNYNEAKKIIDGDSETTIPKAAVFKALKKEAVARGDVDTIQRLARSPLNTEFSQAGQTLGGLRGIWDDFDPTDIIKQIQDAWESKGSKKFNKAIGDMEKYVKSVLDNPDVDGFINEIICK